MDALQAKVSLEGEREAAEAALRELQEQHEELRRKVQGMETQLKDYERMGENWEGSQARLREKVTKLEVLLLWVRAERCGVWEDEVILRM